MMSPGRRPSNSAVAGPQAVTTSSGDDAHNQLCDVAATVASIPTYGLFRLGDPSAYGRCTLLIGVAGATRTGSCVDRMTRSLTPRPEARSIPRRRRDPRTIASHRDSWDSKPSHLATWSA